MPKSLTQFIADALRLPDSPRTAEEATSLTRFSTHSEVVDRRPEFAQLAHDLQKDLLGLIELCSGSATTDRILEIGAGTIALQKISESAISSDIAIADGISCVLSASDIPFSNDTFRAVVAQNVLHHLSDYQTALTEICRVLEAGGILVVIEPYFGKFAKIIFPALFAFEGYDLNAELGTECVKKDGQPLPNQAASYVIFERESDHFKSTFPELKKIHASPMPSGLRYLLTGGLNFRQLAPSRFLRLLRKVEQNRFGKKVLQKLSLHWVIVLQYQPLTQSTSTISS